jgi:hypothetical protein
MPFVLRWQFSGWTERNLSTLLSTANASAEIWTRHFCNTSLGFESHTTLILLLYITTHNVASIDWYCKKKCNFNAATATATATAATAAATTTTATAAATITT